MNPCGKIWDPKICPGFEFLLVPGGVDFSSGERSEKRKKALFLWDPRAENPIDASLIPCTTSLFSCLRSPGGKRAPSSKLQPSEVALLRCWCAAGYASCLISYGRASRGLVFPGRDDPPAFQRSCRAGFSGVESLSGLIDGDPPESMRLGKRDGPPFGKRGGHQCGKQDEDCVCDTHAAGEQRWYPPSSSLRHQQCQWTVPGPNMEHLDSQSHHIRMIYGHSRQTGNLTCFHRERSPTPASIPEQHQSYSVRASTLAAIRNTTDPAVWEPLVLKL
ncbi:unnamed protein product [Pleuronectes platessa]|uniref:Uncharacterized protein n=1 Tax=Pleuronectes platessa TaxID=8262 RepID=A0A9N7Z4Z9_PLEPL|nr:unnamed protein product [Pleuronectes platessa]